MLYSEELGIDLARGTDAAYFCWFLASLLFGARISETTAKKTFRAFMRHGLYGSFVPRRHKREVDIGWFDQPNRQLFERDGKLGEFSGDLRRDPEPYKNARLRSVRSL
ncbi:MAG: hypothetical protein P4M05_10190 [Bradyrhizobium sp.]|nr:hypothetical protein [Bradyrhizobium sp.]